MAIGFQKIGCRANAYLGVEMARNTLSGGIASSAVVNAAGVSRNEDFLALICVSAVLCCMQVSIALNPQVVNHFLSSYIQQDECMGRI